MEVQNKKLRPLIIFQHGKRKRSHVLFDMSNGSYQVRSIRHMRKKDVWLSSHCWLFLKDSFGRFSLLNLASLTEFEVPQLNIQRPNCICVITAPPTDPSCQLFLIANKAPTIYFCRVAEDNKFNEIKLNIFDRIDHFHRAVSCNGKIYFLSYQRKFGEINVDHSKHFPTPRFLDVERPRTLRYSDPAEFLVESCGEIFLVRQVFHGASNWFLSFTVLKMDFSQMRWMDVKSIGDRLFFLSENGSQSCSSLESGLESDRMFFFLPNDVCLYSFHIKEGSISIELVYPNVQPTWKSAFWLMHTRKEERIVMEEEEKSNVKVDMEKIQLVDMNKKAGVKILEDTSIERVFIETRPWSDLPIEVVMLITERLNPVAYARIRSICNSWRSIIPPAWLPLTPCLIFNEGVDGLCKFVDPLSKKVYAADIPELHGTTFHFSKSGWLLVSIDRNSIFFLNPFTKERINLPDLDQLVSAISFSSIPTSPDCVVFAVYNFYPCDNIIISTCTPVAQGWHRYIHLNGVYPLLDLHPVNPVFHNGLFYCLGEQGNLGAYNIIEDTWNVLTSSVPIQFPKGCRCFLMESKGKLICVYYILSDIHIFTLDESKMLWVEVECLEDLILFLDRATSLALTVDKKEAASAIRDMKNRVYTSKIRRGTNDALFYSMESKSHNLDFCKSKEFVDCTWIEPIGYEFSLDSQGNILSVTSRLI